METNATVYRIYVGGRYGEAGGSLKGVKISNLDDIVAGWVKTFYGATVLQGIGIWDGEVEPTRVIEVMIGDHGTPSSGDEEADVFDVAGELKKALKQDSVMVTSERVKVSLLY